MANNYTESSFYVPLTQAEQDIAYEVLALLDDRAVDLLADTLNDHAKEMYSEQSIAIARDYLDQHDDKDEYEEGFFSVGFISESDTNGMYIFHEESINVESAALFVHCVLKGVASDNCVCISVSYSCSKPRTDEFGGQGAFVTKDKIEWLSVWQWLQEKQAEYKNRSAA